MSLFRSNRPPCGDYTRSAPANQLDEGIDPYP